MNGESLNSNLELGRNPTGLGENLHPTRGEVGRIENPALLPSLAQTVVNSLSDGVVAVDLEGRFVQFNPAGKSILRIGATATPREQWSETYGLFRPDRQTPFPTDELPLIQALHGRPVRGVEMFVRHDRLPEGICLQVDAEPMFDERGNQTGAVALFRDVTAQRRAEAALKSERRFLHHLIQTQDRDRQLTAFDLHDGVVQIMTSSVLRLESVLAKVRQSNLATELTAVVDLLHEGIDEARRMIGGMRPPVIDECGIVGALEYLVEHQCRREGLTVELQADDRLGRLPAVYEASIFRIVQEALHNAARHGGATRAVVRFEADDRELRLTVRDEGRGFDAAARDSSRFGLRGMEERARLLGGEARIESQAGAGTTVHVILPRPQADAAEANPESA